MPNDADFSVVAEKIASGREKSLVLTPSNVIGVINNGEKYRGYMFIVDGRLISAKEWWNAFNRVVVDMIRVWKHLD